MKKVNYFVFKEKGGDNTIDVFLEDGSVATTYKSDDYYRTDYYHNRINQTTTVDNLWGELNEGVMYTSPSRWEGEDLNDQQVIDDMVNWLYISTEPIEFIRNDMGEMTEEKFNEIKSKLNV